jgi:hypothetical protein
MVLARREVSKDAELLAHTRPPEINSPNTGPAENRSGGLTHEYQIAV